MNNVLDNHPIRECTSCQVCAAVCPHNAISIGLNVEGFYRPFIDNELCVNCGLCKMSCYKYDKHILDTSDDLLQEKKFFSAWSLDEDVLKNTTSGGVSDVLAKELLQLGYKVLGVVYDDDKARAEHRTANHQEELKLFRGSKYIQSYTLDAFKEVLAYGRKEKYAIFGTPCQIYAIAKVVERLKIRENFFLVDLFCHGCPSLLSWQKYIKEIKLRVNIDSFDVVKFRSKIRGWGRYCIEAEVNGRTVYFSNKYNDPFFELFFSDHILNNSCANCRFRSSLEYSDIRIGDFWGRQFVGNKKGVSAVCVSTKKGREVFDKLKDVESHLCDYDGLLSAQSWRKSYEVDIEARRALLDYLASSGHRMKDVIKVLHKQQNLKKNVYRYIKVLLEFLPRPITDNIKKLYYRISE